MPGSSDEGMGARDSAPTGRASYPRVDGVIVISGAFEEGGDVFLPRKVAGRILPFRGWQFREIRYEKRLGRLRVDMRREFVNGDRRAYLRYLGAAFPERLRDHGFGEDEIARLADGYAPKGYDVHHIIPLDDLGGNEFSNLILIRAREHRVLTAYQNRVSRILSPGGVQVVDFPVPPTGQVVWPPVAQRPAPELELWRKRR